MEVSDHTHVLPALTLEDFDPAGPQSRLRLR